MLLFIKPPKVFTLVFEEATSNVLSPTFISISPPEESTKASLKDLKLFPLSDLKDRRGSFNHVKESLSRKIFETSSSAGKFLVFSIDLRISLMTSCLSENLRIGDNISAFPSVSY